MKCDLIYDEHGWWIQYTDKEGKHHCCLMEATDSLEAQLEAQEQGFQEMALWNHERYTGNVNIPKRGKGEG